MLNFDLDAFLADVAQRSKPATAGYYRSRSKWIRDALGELSWPELTTQRVLCALDLANRRADQQRKAPDTIRGNITAWEQFQTWAVETGRIERPLFDKPLPKPAGRQRSRLPSADEIQRLLAAGDEDFRSIYRALLLTGARPGELCRAQVSDFRPADGVIELADHKTATKTKRPRLIPIGKACRRVVEAAMAGRSDGPIFLRGCGLPWQPAALSQVFRRLRVKLGITQDLVLYSTRHKFATELCHAQGIEAAAAVLGHAGLQTIRRYVHHDNEQLVKYADGVDAAQLLPDEANPPGEERRAA